MYIKDFPRIKALLTEVEACETLLATRSMTIGGHNASVTANPSSDTPRHRELHSVIMEGIREYRRAIIAELKTLDAPVQEEK